MLRARMLSVALLLTAQPFACADTEPNTLSDSQGCRSIPIIDSSTTSSTSTSSTSASSTSASSTGTSSTNIDCTQASDCEGELICIEGICGLALEWNPPNVMLLLDKSGSTRVYSWDADGNPNTPDVTRWFSLRSVVESIIDNLENSANLGLVLFPSKSAITEYSANACLVEEFPEVPAAPQNGAAILAAMPPAMATSDQLQGGTPTRLAMLTAIDHISSLDESQPRFLILITDGTADCSPDAQTDVQLFEVYDDGLVQVVSDAAINGIPTFVIGIDINDEFSGIQQDGFPDNVNTYDKLNTLAIAGGVPKDDPKKKFYEPQDQLQLQDALQTIAGQMLPPCVIELEPAPVYPDSVDIEINGMPFDQIQESDCDSENGWAFVNDTSTRIQLCDELCTDFLSGGTLNVLYRLP